MPIFVSTVNLFCKLPDQDARHQFDNIVLSMDELIYRYKSVKYVFNGIEG